VPERRPAGKPVETPKTAWGAPPFKVVGYRPITLVEARPGGREEEGLTAKTTVN